ncbi:hypothetical protein CspeluHIS016_0106650 [Cutaneotrichosporon spelunceum]|uniref:Major facilitator superfamily (MFS) profile domain-containing protein n=1 Tax=Cutaneotrichosporon spelunceum TaxID=1672016 RepID=A0AAD3TP74_9TREE|nr:hypothetical protein CspeluHIS016_0106650 [Cutaneotrichosporon spelunceum]
MQSGAPFVPATLAQSDSRNGGSADVQSESSEWTTARVQSHSSDIDRTTAGLSEIDRHEKGGHEEKTLSIQASIRPALSPSAVSLCCTASELVHEPPREEKSADPSAVAFEPDEETDPKNWSRGFRWYLTVLTGMLVLNSTFASSAPAGITEDTMKHFGVGPEVAVLCISLFVAGYCVGPLLWRPLSESYGRRPIFLLSFAIYTCFQVGCALAPNTGVLLAFRFLSGTFAAAPLTYSGAVITDLWDVDTRGSAMALFGIAPFAGPSLGPIVSGFIQTAGADWRWVYWVTTMFAGVCTLFIVFTLPETYGPIILKKKAERLRKETGDGRWYAPIERHPHDTKTRFKDILLKPFIMLFLEPMLMAVTIYMSFVYGIVYLLLEAYPSVFMANHGFTSAQNGLAFLGFFAGSVVCTFLCTLAEHRYQAAARRLAPLPVRPEKRLEMCALTGPLLVLALFWFGWTSAPPIHWISPVLAGALIGVAALGMFLSPFNHIIDSYLANAASALAACTVVRSAFGAGFALFAGRMYAQLGTRWASSVLGFAALLLAPVPLVLVRLGPRLRARSRFTPAEGA